MDLYQLMDTGIICYLTAVVDRSLSFRMSPAYRTVPSGLPELASSDVNL
jgi:hypothetical protein